MKPLRRLLPLLALLLPAACGTSPETHYFTLAAAPGTGRAAAAPSDPVTVAAVHLPPALDRKELLRRTGANTVEISGEDRWTAPLDTMTRRVLSQDLAERLPADKVVPPEAPTPPRTGEIVVTLAEFGPDAQGGATLSGSWWLLAGEEKKPVLRRDVHLSVAAPGPGPADEAAAMSELLSALADKIAADLTEAQGRKAARHAS
jgi:uncharacterized lipoprotein YmbA